MSLYIVQCRKSSNGNLIGYVARGRIVQRRRNATVYSSPSAAESAARAMAFVTPGHYFRVMGNREPSRGA